MDDRVDPFKGTRDVVPTQQVSFNPLDSFPRGEFPVRRDARPLEYAQCVVVAQEALANRGADKTASP